MTMTVSVSAPRRAAQARRPHRDWPRALRALRRILKDKEDTSQVFEIMHALNGRSHVKGYDSLLNSPEGGRIAYEREELSEKMMDAAWMASFPPGSVGAAYANYLATEHLTAMGLINESHKGVGEIEEDRLHPHAWYSRRIRDLHDIWHVLTGYGRDALGEVCLVTFCYQETHGLGWALLSSGGYLRCHGPVAAQARKAIAEAARRGRHAAWLPGEDYGRLLFEPLDDVRRRLRLTTPAAYEAVPKEQRNLSLN